MDVFERTLYNGTLSGVSLSGDRFFYPNTLEYDGAAKNNHGHAGRAPWFGCACCPPNLMRLLASLGGYVAASAGTEVWINLYAAGDLKVATAAGEVALNIETDYPCSGEVRIVVNPEHGGEFTLRLRLPGWARGYPLPSDLYSYTDATPSSWSVEVNGIRLRPALENGYLVITRTWRAGDSLRLFIEMPVRRVVGHPDVAATRGQVALERGPIVYSFEGADHGGDVSHLALSNHAALRPVHRPEFLGGVTVIEIDEVDSDRAPTPALAIPYALWANRGPSPMRVWLPRCFRAFPGPAPLA